MENLSNIHLSLTYASHLYIHLYQSLDTPVQIILCFVLEGKDNTTVFPHYKTISALIHIDDSYSVRLLSNKKLLAEFTASSNFTKQDDLINDFANDLISDLINDFSPMITNYLRSALLKPCSLHFFAR